MSDMIFRLAAAADIDGIMEVIADGQEFIRSQGFVQWANGYPDRKTLLKDIAAGNAYALDGAGEIFGVAVAIPGEEPTYRIIHGGEWGSNVPYITIHRMGVRSSAHGKGAGGRLIAGVEGLCRERGISCIRMDTHRENKPMRGLVEKHGFTYRGVIHLLDGQERVAYDKLI